MPRRKQDQPDPLIAAWLDVAHAWQPVEQVLRRQCALVTLLTTKRLLRQPLSEAEQQSLDRALAWIRACLDEQGVTDATP